MSDPVTKPALYRCGGNGDFSLVLDLPHPPMMPTMPDQTLNAERLTATGTSGTGEASTKLAGMTATEAPGAYRDPSGIWVLAFNELRHRQRRGRAVELADDHRVGGPGVGAPGDLGDLLRRPEPHRRHTR